jgi:hypothetical protein
MIQPPTTSPHPRQPPPLSNPASNAPYMPPQPYSEPSLMYVPMGAFSHKRDHRDICDCDPCEQDPHNACEPIPTMSASANGTAVNLRCTRCTPLSYGRAHHPCRRRHSSSRAHPQRCARTPGRVPSRGSSTCPSSRCRRCPHPCHPSPCCPCRPCPLACTLALQRASTSGREIGSVNGM